MKMTCETIQNQFDDYLDHTLQPEIRHHMDAHLKGCTVCREELALHQAMLSGLRRLPVVPASQGLYARIMREGRAQCHGASSEYRMRAAGGLLVLCLVAVLSVGLWPSSRVASVPELQAISLQVFETREITLAFNVPADMDNVMFTLRLPKGVELEGHPDKTQLAWTNRLRQGRNVMNLKLKGKTSLQGELIARIEHNGLKREFKVPLKVVGMDGAEVDLPVDVGNFS